MKTGEKKFDEFEELVLELDMARIIFAEEEEEEEEARIVVSIKDITERKRTEEALHRSEENFHRSLDDSPLGIRIVTIEGETVYANRAMLDIYGFDSIEELNTTPVKKRYTPESYAEFQIRKEKRRKGEYDPSEYEVSIVRKNGEVRHLQVFRKEILWNGGRRFQTIYQDITERKRAEEELRTQNKTFSQVLNGLDALVYVVDMKTYELVFINTYGQNIWGDVKGKICWQTIQAGKASPCEFCTNSKLIGPDGNPTEGVVWEFQNTVNKRWYDCRDRAIYWPDGRIVRMEIATDITDRKRTEVALRESEERLKEAQRVGHLGSWDLNVVTGDLQWSDECYSIYGFRPQEFVPTYEKFRSIVHPEDLGFVQEQVDAALNNDKHYDVDFRFVRPNGEIGWLHCEGEVMRDAEGKPLRFFGTQSDITDRKQAEERIHASLREKEILLSEVHHRVKNNMQVISGLLDLQAKSSGNPELIERLNESQSRIRSMALIHEKLYGSKDFARVDLAGYVRTLSQGLFQSYKINPGEIDLIVQPDGDVYVDINKAIPCGLILNELISNALKHAFPGDGPHELRIIIRETKNTEIEIVVRDNGLGLPDDVDIHQPRTVGLHLVNGLVKNQLDGQIEVRRDNGTEFRIKFPL